MCSLALNSTTKKFVALVLLVALISVFAVMAVQVNQTSNTWAAAGAYYGYNRSSSLAIGVVGVWQAGLWGAVFGGPAGVIAGL